MTSEENKIDGLLKQRYKCKGVNGKHYPFSDFSVGDILFERAEGCWTDNLETGENVSSPEDYPHLFEPLPWYAERKVEDMPGFLKSIKQDFVCCPIYHEKEDSGLFIIDEDEPNQYFVGDFLPATEQEYQSYISKTKV